MVKEKQQHLYIIRNSGDTSLVSDGCGGIYKLSRLTGQGNRGTSGLLKKLHSHYAVIYKLLIEKGYFVSKLDNAL
jgi:hypothetical protein